MTKKDDTHTHIVRCVNAMVELELSSPFLLVPVSSTANANQSPAQRRSIRRGTVHTRDWVQPPYESLHDLG